MLPETTTEVNNQSNISGRQVVYRQKKRYIIVKPIYIPRYFQNIKRISVCYERLYNL